jgi:hypothetical protein
MLDVEIHVVGTEQIRRSSQLARVVRVLPRGSGSYSAGHVAVFGQLADARHQRVAGEVGGHPEEVQQGDSRWPRAGRTAPRWRSVPGARRFVPSPSRIMMRLPAPRSRPRSSLLPVRPVMSRVQLAPESWQRCDRVVPVVGQVRILGACPRAGGARGARRRRPRRRRARDRPSSHWPSTALSRCERNRVLWPASCMSTASPSCRPPSSTIARRSYTPPNVWTWDARKRRQVRQHQPADRRPHP